jgi:hypothetical protein
MGHRPLPATSFHIRFRFSLLALTLAAAAWPHPSQAGASDQATPGRGQAERSEGVQRDAGVPDETHASGQAMRPARPVAPLPPPYGPVLRPRVPGAAAPVDAAPAEVPDETNGQTPAAAPPAQPQPQTPRQPRHHPQRRPASQPPGPMAPRPLDGDASGVPASPVPVPRLSTPAQPVVPSSTIAGPCQGGICTDAAGGTVNGGGPAGVSSGGRLCVRSAATVQCF